MTARELAIQPPAPAAQRDRRDAILAARVAATRAAARAGVSIRQLEGIAEMKRVAHLFQAIWGKSDELGPPINSDLLRALAHAGNYVAGAFDATGAMQSALVSFLGGPQGAVHVHSHILGVVPGNQARGAGFALKLDQRAWSLAQGYDSMEWTFDPLVRRNAYFNLTKLRSDINDYLVNFYGAMEDGQNGSDDSDRLLVHWDLLSDAVEAAAAGTPAEPLAAGERATFTALLTVGEKGQPVTGQHGGGGVLLQVPADIVRMRIEAPDVAVQWRLALRRAMVELLDGGHRCAGVTRDGEYVFHAR
ncbi:MAG: GNAT family N-acetyltransferase [Candidatus Dormibacteria bacterium]